MKYVTELPGAIAPLNNWVGVRKYPGCISSASCTFMKVNVTFERFFLVTSDPFRRFFWAIFDHFFGSLRGHFGMLLASFWGRFAVFLTFFDIFLAFLDIFGGFGLKNALRPQNPILKKTR